MNIAKLTEILERGAAKAPDFTKVQHATLLRRIRSRRRMRTTATVAISAAAVSSLAVGTLSGVMWLRGSSHQDNAHPGGRELAMQQTFDIGSCNEPVTPTTVRNLPLAMTIEFPSTTQLRDGGILRGSITIINVSADQLTVTTSRNPDMTLASSNQVVSTPLGQRQVAVQFDLPPGDSRSFDAAVSLERCPRTERVSSKKEPTMPPVATLTAGRYELYAEQKITLESPSDSEASEFTVQAGPHVIRLE